MSFKTPSASPLCPVCGSKHNIEFSFYDLHYGYPGKVCSLQCANCRHMWVENISTIELRPLYTSDSYYSTRLSGPKKSHILVYVIFLLRRLFRGEHNSLFDKLISLLPHKLYIQSLVHYYLSKLSSPGLIDYGSGSGGFLSYFVPYKYKLQGYDINSSSTHPKINRLDFESPFLIETLGLSFSSHTLEHLQNPSTALTSIRNSMSKDELLILVLPNISSAAFDVLKNNWYFLGPPWHLHCFSIKSLKLLLSQHQLSTISVSSQYDWIALTKSISSILAIENVSFFAPLNALLLLLLYPFLQFTHPLKGDHVVLICKKISS